jgi:pimeloyl-ACP methyl ester carboxylesterase
LASGARQQSPHPLFFKVIPNESVIFLEANMQDIRVKANGIELQIREYEQDGDAIIFLHFGGANLRMWQRIIPYFQDHYRLILVDLRGHGKSDRPETGYHMDEMARDVIGMMQQLKLERAHIVGSSLGAEVGLSMAANYPEKVLSLVLDGALSSEYGPYGIWEGSETDFEEHVTRQLEKIRNTPETIFPSVDALVDGSREVLEKLGWWNEYVEAVERYGAYKIDAGKYTKAFGKQAKEDYMKHYFHYRFEDYYGKVKCPLLMLPGEEELENEREKAVMEGLRELAPQGQIVAVSGWVHPYGWLLNPEEVCKAILKFLGHPAD